MATWISFFLGLLCTPIATRLFPAAEYGRLSLFSAWASLLSSACYLGLDQAFVRFFGEAGRGGRRGLLALCMGIPAAAFLMLLGVLGLFFRGSGAPDALLFVCLAAYALCLLLSRFISLCYRMEQDAARYTLQGVLFALATKIAYLAVGVAFPTARAAILCLTLLTAAVTLAFLPALRRRASLGELRAMDRGTLRAVRGYALPLAPMPLLVWLQSYASPLLLERLMGYDAAGVYAGAAAIASTVHVVQSGFSVYWAPYVLSTYRREDARFDAVHRMMACLLTLFCLGVTLLQTPALRLLGPAYRAAGTCFPFLFLAPVCACLGETTGMGITLAKKTFLTPAIYLLSALMSAGLCLLLIPRMGMAGAAAASALSAAAALLLRTLAGQRYYRALHGYRALFGSLSLLFAAAFGNLLLRGAAKYALLLALLLAALALFRRELAALWRAAGQIIARRRAEEDA